MRIGLGNDHAALSLRAAVITAIEELGHELVDFGTDSAQSVDFPDYAGLVGRALQRQEIDRGILLCGSGVGMAIAANKLHGVRASVTHDIYSAHQGVEHDGMNVMCLGARVIGVAVAGELVRAFLQAEFEQEDRFVRRLNKVSALETTGK